MNILNFKFHTAGVSHTATSPRPGANSGGSREVEERFYGEAKLANTIYVIVEVDHLMFAIAKNKWQVS